MAPRTRLRRRKHLPGGPGPGRIQGHQVAERGDRYHRWIPAQKCTPGAVGRLAGPWPLAVLAVTATLIATGVAWVLPVLAISGWRRRRPAHPLTTTRGLRYRSET